MSFRETVAFDNQAVFMNADEYARLFTIAYDGSVYADVKCVFTKISEMNRSAISNSRYGKDHAEGLYLSGAVLYFDASDMNGALPEKGTHIRLTDECGNAKRYLIDSCARAFGMNELTLKDVDE